jgi:hypothetical protein
LLYRGGFQLNGVDARLLAQLGWFRKWGKSSARHCAWCRELIHSLWGPSILPVTECIRQSAFKFYELHITDSICRSVQEAELAPSIGNNPNAGSEGLPKSLERVLEWLPEQPSTRLWEELLTQRHG